MTTTPHRPAPGGDRRARWEAAARAAGREIDHNALTAYMTVADAEMGDILARARKLVDSWETSGAEHAEFAKSPALAEHPSIAKRQEGRSDQLYDCAGELALVLAGEDPDEWEHSVGLEVSGGKESAEEPARSER